ncbi:MAG: hypothetical protein M3362_26265 [Acidobacteriota bacterium]|nr:hypothetical protein [Acidobacteriota bacterium]
MNLKSTRRQLERMEQEIGKPEGCEVCKEYDSIPALSNAETEKALLNEYAQKAERPEGVIRTVAYKVLCKDCRRPYVQIVHVKYVEGRR